MSVDQAESTLEDAGFNAIRGGTVASGNPAGTVAYTLPSGGCVRPRRARSSRSTRRPASRPRRRAADGGNGGGNERPRRRDGGGGGHGGPRRGADGARGPQAPSWRRTSAATAPPSARPLTCGVHDAHHLAHRLHALAGRADLGDRRR